VCSSNKGLHSKMCVLKKRRSSVGVSKLFPTTKNGNSGLLVYVTPGHLMPGPGTMFPLYSLSEVQVRVRVRAGVSENTFLIKRVFEQVSRYGSVCSRRRGVTTNLLRGGGD